MCVMYSIIYFSVFFTLPQVVSGKKYNLVIELGETNCHKFDPSIGNGEHCALDPTEEHEVRVGA